MSLISVPFESISAANLHHLIMHGVPESLTIDYKRDMYGGSEADRREFLADVSSFANTIGGDILIGISEKEGVPIEVRPFSGDADAAIRRLENIALGGLEPRLGSLRIRSIPVEGGSVLIVRVPRSLLVPHRVIAQNSNRFFARAGTSKYEPNVTQLRDLFSSVPLSRERIRSFHADRLVKIYQGETPLPISKWGKIVLHVCPLPAFSDGRMSDIVSEIARGTHVPLPPDDVGFPLSRSVNLDGYLTYSSAQLGCRAYAQFFRNGCIEGVGAFRSEEDGSTHFITRDLTNLVVSRVKQYLSVLESYDLGLPVYIFLSISNVERFFFRQGQPHQTAWVDTPPLAREIVSLPEVYVDNYDADVIDLMRPAFTTLWNAFGVERCERYDDTAKWKASDPYALNWR